MAIRDLLIFAIVFGSLPVILFRPYVGVLMWSWLAYMNPHRLSWGAAFDFRFSLIVGAVVLVAVAVSSERKRMRWTPVTIVWLMFFIWTWLTTLFAYSPEDAASEWSRWWKINLMSILTLLVMQSRERITMLVAVIAVSLGFYGVKGGIFTVLTGGSFHVFGPPGSFIEDNNAMALAMILALPLMRYLQLEAQNKWIRRGLAASMALTAFAILGTQSRGALLGIVAMAGYLVWKSPGRLKMLFVMGMLVPILWAFMPESWHSRMDTIATYEQDSSAMGRINAWWFAFNLANERPLIGGGFNTFTPELFQRHAPDPEDFHDAHSIYFEVLAEQGYVGLVLFLLLGWLVIRSGAGVARQTRDRPDLAWARHLSAMIQVALVGYAVSGAFLGLAYFDLFYHLVVIAVVTRGLVEDALRQPLPAAPPAAAVSATAPALPRARGGMRF